MKRRLHLLSFLLMFSVLIPAQSLITENFSAGTVPPDGWTIDAHAANWSSSGTANAGGSSPEAKLFYSPSFNATSHLISPSINTNGYTSLTLSFRHFLDDNSGTAYSIGVATLGSSGPWHDAWTVSVEKDIALSKINVPRFSLGEDLQVKGTVIDMGLDPIIGFALNYQIDSGEVITEGAVGFNMSLGESYNFILPDLLNLDPGDYMLKMWVSDVNGTGPDMSPENDTAYLDLHVASQSVARKPLFEEFTSSTCGPCATFNGTVFNAFVATNYDQLTLVKYQMDWPGNGDPYYTEEGGVRRAYYGVSYVPDLYTDGDQTATTSGGVNTAFTNSLATPAFMDLSAYHVIDGNNVFVHLDIDSHIGGEVVAYIVVFENITTQNTGGNGETEFHHVMMKMIPDASGTVVTLTDGAKMAQVSI